MSERCSNGGLHKPLYQIPGGIICEHCSQPLDAVGRTMTPQDTSQEDARHLTLQEARERALASLHRAEAARVEAAEKDAAAWREDAMTQEQQERWRWELYNGGNSPAYVVAPSGARWLVYGAEGLAQEINARLPYTDATEGEWYEDRGSEGYLIKRQWRDENGHRYSRILTADIANAQAAALRTETAARHTAERQLEVRRHVRISELQTDNRKLLDALDNERAAREAAEASKAEIQRQRNDLAEQLGLLTEYITASDGHYCDGMSMAWLDAQHAIDKQHEAEAERDRSDELHALEHKQWVEANNAAVKLRERAEQAEARVETLTAAGNQFVNQLAIKQVPPHPPRVVWAGDYDSIYPEDLQRLVLNFMGAWSALTSPASTGEQEVH